MNTDEKIAAYSEKVEVKKKKLDEINTVIEKKKAAAAALKADIDALSMNIFQYAERQGYRHWNGH